MTTKRSLRNSNTCPSTQNPFTKDGDDPIKGYVPPSISRYIPTTSNITCTQITTLPIFNNQNSLDDALQYMKRAMEWQSNQITHLKNRDKSVSGEVDHSEFREQEGEDQGCPPQQGKSGPENRQVSSLMDIDLQGFLMEPPYPIIDFEYPFNPHLIQPESIQESSPFDIADPDF